MPLLRCYLSNTDASQLLHFLNESNEIAFIVADGDRCWKAVPNIPGLSPGRYCLWHTLSGPLPLLRKDNQSEGQITDPWSGWIEERRGADTSQPYFGAGHPGVIWLGMSPVECDESSKVLTIGMSSFSWIGNHYRIIGFGAEPATENWWKSLRKYVQQHAVKVPRGGLSYSTKPEIWAFPDAQRMFAKDAMGKRNPI